jgi:hypothetical protein
VGSVAKLGFSFVTCAALAEAITTKEKIAEVQWAKGFLWRINMLLADFFLINYVVAI